MPELNIAPPPSANTPLASVAPATAPTGPATTDTAELPDESFAAMLMAKVAASLKNTNNTTEATATLPADAALATAPAQNEDEVPVDAIALLAPLLPGIAASMPPTGSASPHGDEKVLPDMETETTAAPVLGTDLAGTVPQLVAPITPAMTASAPTRPAASDLSAPMPQLNIAPERNSPGAPTVAIAATDIPVTANLAAEKPAPALVDGVANIDKNVTTPPNQFETLLANARGDAMSAQHSIASHIPAPATPTHVTTEIATPVGTHGWDSAVGEKITWMVGRQETRAELVLNPPQLGRIEVSLSMNGDQTNAVFVSANPAVREALENAVPRLREMLQDAGISLGQAQVGAESFQQSADRGENNDNRPRRPFTGVTEDAPATGLVAGTPSQWLRSGNGLVDTFA